VRYSRGYLLQQSLPHLQPSHFSQPHFSHLPWAQPQSSHLQSSPQQQAAVVVEEGAVAAVNPKPLAARPNTEAKRILDIAILQIWMSRRQSSRREMTLKQN
jgi:hypothetical protein